MVSVIPFMSLCDVLCCRPTLGGDGIWPAFVLNESVGSGACRFASSKAWHVSVCSLVLKIAMSTVGSMKYLGIKVGGGI